MKIKLEYHELPVFMVDEIEKKAREIVLKKNEGKNLDEETIEKLAILEIEDAKVSFSFNS